MEIKRKKSSIGVIKMITIIVLINFSCTREKDIYIPPLISEKTAKIKTELEEYYQHRNDTFKSNAAAFLVNHGKYRSHFEGERIEAYTRVLKEVEQHSGVQYYHLSKLQGQSFSPDSVVFDLQQLSADEIVNHVDKIVNFYYSLKWNEKISFDVFCEYLLPYNIERESFSHWTDYYRSQYFAEEDSSYMSGSFKAAVATIHRWDYRKTQGFRLEWGSKALSIPEISAVTLGKLKVGTCQQLATRSCAILRSLGVPATIDYTPTYLNMASGHLWTVAVLDDDTFIPLDATTKKTGVYRNNSYLISKVYRRTFSVQKNSHVIQRGTCNFLPAFFNDPFCMDVTQHYVSTSELKIPIEKELKGKTNFVYLSLFTPRNGWEPIAWGTIEKGKACFSKVGRGGVYLPVCIDAESKEYLNAPFLLSDSGLVKYLIPDQKRKLTMKLLRKFPMTNNKRMFLERMVGGIFQGANNPDFSDAVTLAEIKNNPGEHINTVNISNSKGFKFVRYCAPLGSHCNVAEIEFYSPVFPDSVLKGEVIGTDGSWENNAAVSKEVAFDGNPLTYVDLQRGDNTWVGLKLRSQVPIGEIRYLARNDMNSTQVGNEYELFYWHNKWVSMGKKVATTVEVVYEDVPSGALYWLKNLTTGKEERIFTYENGQQVWW
jgi:hypothetical protein